MNITMVNRSTFSDKALQGIVDFLGPCFGDISMPVRLTFKSKRGMGTWGKAYWPTARDHRTIKRGEYAAVVYIGTVPGNYPHMRTYKKVAGGYTAESLVDEIVHTTAHELRHLEQFEVCLQARKWDPDRSPRFGRVFRHWEHTSGHFQRNSCEIDAETVAHSLLDAYKYALQNDILRSAA